MANRIRVSTEVLNAGVAGVEAQAVKVKSITGEMLNIVNNMSLVAVNLEDIGNQILQRICL